ncbi:hypothetical protein PG984_012932 [Apiospora sp. TS-2023a]
MRVDVLALCILLFHEAMILVIGQGTVDNGGSLSTTSASLSQPTTSFGETPTPTPDANIAQYPDSSCDFDPDSNDWPLREPGVDDDEPGYGDGSDDDDEPPIGAILSSATGSRRLFTVKIDGYPGIHFKSKPYPGSA